MIVVRKQVITMTFSYPKHSDGITIDTLSKAPPQIQKDVMRQWFFENYEDPVENTPYESREGGYQYIWGGPYNAHEELDARFSGIVPYEVIEELAEELGFESAEWAGIPEYEASDDYFVDAIQSNVDPRKTAKEGLAKIQSLLAEKISSDLELHMFRLLYVNTITCLEAYLFDNLLNQVMSIEELKKRLVETSPEFAQKKMSVSKIYQKFENLDNDLREYLSSLLWHDLGRVKRLYENVYQIEFPDISELAKAVRKRHDIVHRNGKTKDRSDVILNKKNVEDLISEVEAFIDSIEQLINPF
jgi:uncharacterized coiled-coil protein SlyX